MYQKYCYSLAKYNLLYENNVILQRFTKIYYIIYNIFYYIHLRYKDISGKRRIN